jgi:hypothetical protein
MEDTVDTINARPARSDRIGLYFAVSWVALGAALAIVAAVERLMDVAPGTGIPVLVPLAGEMASLPLGPDGAAVAVDVASATIIVADPSPATLFALWAQPLWLAAVVCAAMVLSALFFLRLARGRAFSRGAAMIAFVGAALVLANWVADSILTSVTTNGALSAISDNTYQNWTLEFSLAPVLGVLVLAATGAALQIGERLQRETAGLV